MDKSVLGCCAVLCRARYGSAGIRSVFMRYIELIVSIHMGLIFDLSFYPSMSVGTKDPPIDATLSPVSYTQLSQVRGIVY